MVNLGTDSGEVIIKVAHRANTHPFASSKFPPLCKHHYLVKQSFSVPLVVYAQVCGEPKPVPQSAPKPAPKGKHVQLFKMRCKVGKGFYSVYVHQNAVN